MTAITVEKVNLNSIPATEAAAIRAAEAEAETFHNAIEAEETERYRIAELKTVCGLMWHHRATATEVATQHLSNNNVFTAAETEAILRVSSGLHPEAETRSAIKALDFINTVSRLYRTMKSGYYFDNLPATELLRKS